VSATHFQFREGSVLSQLAYQVVSLSGAVLVLIGYAALQRGLLQREDRWFNLLNFAGSALLAWIAILDRRWGFILLEVAWAVLSIPPLVRRPRRPSG
jgi:threonine/homoserine/homoserine lactone efflux protein